jgi:hypothetical protein
VVTFTTSSGVFGSTSATPGTSAQQIFSTHCGAIPNTAPVVLLPQAGLPFTTSFSFTSCQTATAVLFGGGAAGTATVTANYIADFTGATASNATTVAFSPNAATVSLTRGCNEVILPGSLLATGAASITGANIVAAVQPAGVVVSIWQFNNSLHAFQALYFSTAGAPTDIASVAPGSSVFICVSSTATFPTGAF